ncbi:isochorismatase family protein [Ideonella sp. DXS22W]|uniref:Isochorismatase family protein n=1 Tax=Pseudaquabacterium inlustre TaxID=2984192 RepID=A0ABU9CNT4_9BURK
MSASSALPAHPATTALLLIDVQQSFKHRPYWSEADLPAYLAATAALLAGCMARGVPIVRIFHTDGPRSADNPFALESGLVRPLDGLLPFDAALTVEKHRHSALVGTGLAVWLHQQGIRRLMVAGIRTEQCCETTARHASDEGWTVDFVTEATLTFDMRTPAGQPLTAAQIRERTATVLAGRFATLVGVDEALSRAA